VSNSMSVFQAKTISDLKDFAKQPFQLGITPRQAPESANAFFQKLMVHPFSIANKVRKKSADDDIRVLLEDDIPAALQGDLFFETWVEDMANICRLFCDIQDKSATGFWLGTSRGCKRYHIDNVPIRLLVTYAGTGTEWLPDDAADRAAFADGLPNEKIVKDLSAWQFMNPWDVAIFRGGSEGLIHRTPDDALNDASILMRLDHPKFWENIWKIQQKSA